MTPLDITTAFSDPGAARIARRCAVLLPAIALALAGCRDDVPSPLAPTLGKGGTPGKPGSAEAVLFTGFRNGNQDIYMMNPDGANIRRVTTDTAVDESPDFSADNRKLVWVRYDSTAKSELFVANVDGSKPTQITAMGTNVFTPRFSPDGTKIVFSASLNGNLELYVVNPDGSGLKRLTYDQGQDQYPTWTPDGQRIAWATTRDGASKIYWMNSDGLNVQPLVTWCSAACIDPAFSPDGSRIAYTDVANNVIKVYEFFDDFGPRALGPSDAGETRFPTWTKDGTQVLFASRRGIENSWELYVGIAGRTDGASVRRLTVFSPGWALQPAHSH